MKVMTPLALLLALPALLFADWEDDLLEELKSLGYSKKEIERALEEGRASRKAGPDKPDLILPPDQIKRETNKPVDELSDNLRKRLEDLGYSGKDLDRQVSKYSRMSADKRELRLGELEEEAALEKWIEEMLEPITETLDSNDWPAGEMKSRLSDEEDYFKDVKPLYDDAAEEVGADEEPQVDEKKLKKERDQFEEELAENYIKEVEKKARDDYSDEVMEGLLEKLAEYVDLHAAKRKTVIVKLARAIKAEILAEREKEFKDAGQVILQDLKVIWAEISLPPGDRRGRKADINMMCGDLAACDTASKFKKVFESQMKKLKKNGYHKDELSVILEELQEMSP